MPDISMCQAKGCSGSPTCRRHTDSGTTPDPLRQSYMAFKPQDSGDPCDHYWPTLNRFTLPDDNSKVNK